MSAIVTVQANFEYFNKPKVPVSVGISVVCFLKGNTADGYAITFLTIYKLSVAFDFRTLQPERVVSHLVPCTENRVIQRVLI